MEVRNVIRVIDEIKSMISEVEERQKRHDKSVNDWYDRSLAMLKSKLIDRQTFTDEVFPKKLEFSGPSPLNGIKRVSDMFFSFIEEFSMFEKKEKEFYEILRKEKAPVLPEGWRRFNVRYMLPNMIEGTDIIYAESEESARKKFKEYNSEIVVIEINKQ